jgi:hypothetical protein
MGSCAPSDAYAYLSKIVKEFGGGPSLSQIDPSHAQEFVDLLRSKKVKVAL